MHSSLFLICVFIAASNSNVSFQSILANVVKRDVTTGAIIQIRGIKDSCQTDCVISFDNKDKDSICAWIRSSDYYLPGTGIYYSEYYCFFINTEITNEISKMNKLKLLQDSLTEVQKSERINNIKKNGKGKLYYDMPVDSVYNVINCKPNTHDKNEFWVIDKNGNDEHHFTCSDYKLTTCKNKLIDIYKK